MAPDLETHKSFSDFPDDVQLNILSFLRPIEISAFACTCRRFAALCNPTSPSADLWFALCHRRWGSKTDLRRWPAAPSPRLYKTLDRWDNLIGFWRRIGSVVRGTPPLVLFEWSPSCIIGSRISPSSVRASYAVRKNPFFWLGLSAAGETLSYLLPDDPLSDSDVIPVTISFLAMFHFVVEEARTPSIDPTIDDSDEFLGLESGSPPDRLMSEIYQYFANRTSPGAERKKKKKKERLGSRGWPREHFVRISDYFPTPSRPLQGLWKGISEGMRLEFFLVTHDDVGGLDCRRVGDTAEPFAGYSPVFWTTNTTFLESPFSEEEDDMYRAREHLGFVGSVDCNVDWGIVVSRIMCINCSYDLVLPDLAGSSGDPRNVEGRIWQYEDGTFGFGFLRENFIVDLKRVALDGYILDDVDSSRQSQRYVS